MSLDVSLKDVPDQTAIATVRRVLVDSFGDDQADLLMAAAWVGGRSEASERMGGEFSANITHNLGKMADAAGIYEACWRPFMLKLTAEEREEYERLEALGDYTASGKIEEQAEARVRARDLVTPLRVGLALMRSDPERFRKHDAPNGWGLYEHFEPWVAKYLDACIAMPNATVHAWR